MSDETVQNLPSTPDAPSSTDNANLQDMFSQFLKTSEENQLRHQAKLSAIKAVVDRLSGNLLLKVPRIMLKRLRITAKLTEEPPSSLVYHPSTKPMLLQHRGYHQQLLVLHYSTVHQFQQLLQPFKFYRQKLFIRTS